MLVTSTIIHLVHLYLVYSVLSAITIILAEFDVHNCCAVKVFSGRVFSLVCIGAGLQMLQQLVGMCLGAHAKDGWLRLVAGF